MVEIFFFFQAEDGIRDKLVTGVQTCALPISFVRLETERSLISLACARPLEEAVWRASFQLMEWLMADYGCSQRMAYLLLGINPGFRINVYQMALIGRLQYTAGAEIPKYLVPGTKA